MLIRKQISNIVKENIKNYISWHIRKEQVVPGTAGNQKAKDLE
jgi:hypothetical protein